MSSAPSINLTTLENSIQEYLTTQAGPTSPSASPIRKKKRLSKYTPRVIQPPTQSSPRPVLHFSPLEGDDGALPAFPRPTYHAMQAALCQNTFPSTALPLILDTGASVSVSHDRADFVGPLQRVQHTTLQGIASGLPIEGVGTVLYTCRDIAGNLVKLTIPGVLYVPSCPGCLIYPRQLIAALPQPAHFAGTATYMDFYYKGGRLHVPYDNSSKLPILHTSASPQAFVNYCTTHSNQNSATPGNLTPAQQIKLRWHQRLNHASFDQITMWMRNGVIRVSPDVTNSVNPLCTACLYGKAKRRTHISHISPISHTHTTPGAGISADQFEAGTLGIVPADKGLPTKMTYRYCNFWVDNYSKLIFVTMHASKDTRELLHSKAAFERFCRQHGISIRSIRADNGIYSAQSFRQNCDVSDQALTFCGVGSHWQNGIAKRAIGIIQATARTILLHAMANWPTIVNDSFWPFAVHHSVLLHNISCRRGHTQSPWELFTGAPLQKSLSDTRVFGCPAYVLHKSAQDNPGSTKTWAECCWQGIYVGQSTAHANTVALIYNPSSKHVTPQFHVTYDESFSTVHLTDPTTLETRLSQLCNSKASWHYTDLHGDPEHYFFNPPSQSPTTAPSGAPTVHLAKPTHSSGRPLYKPAPCSSAFRHWRTTASIAAEVYYCHYVPTTGSSETPCPQSEGAQVAPLTTPSTPPKGAAATPFTTPTSPPTPIPIPSDMPTCEGATPTPDSPGLHMHRIFSSPPSADGDTLTQSAMLRAPDKEHFIKAQLPEITGLEAQGVFTYHPIQELPPCARLLNAIWSYKRKRTPTGALIKHKSRLCTDGSQQRQGIDFTATYAPVVAWSASRPRSCNHAGLEVSPGRLHPGLYAVTH